MAADAEDTAASRSGFTAAVKGVATMASIALAPETGGASLAVEGAAASAVGDASGIGGLY